MLQTITVVEDHYPSMQEPVAHANLEMKRPFHSISSELQITKLPGL